MSRAVSGLSLRECGEPRIVCSDYSHEEDFDTVLDWFLFSFHSQQGFSFHSTHQENWVSAQFDVRNRSKPVPRDCWTIQNSQKHLKMLSLRTAQEGCSLETNWEKLQIKGQKKKGEMKESRNVERPNLASDKGTCFSAEDVCNPFTFLTVIITK